MSGHDWKECGIPGGQRRWACRTCDCVIFRAFRPSADARVRLSDADLRLLKPERDEAMTCDGVAVLRVMGS